MSWLRHLYFKFLYFRQPPWDTQISPPELIEFIDHHPPGRALDLGCGTGTNVITLAEHGWQVIGVDYVKSAINRAKYKAVQAGVDVSFILSDVTKLKNVKGVFDLVLDIGCFHSLNKSEKQSYVANLERLTIPGSTYLIYGFLHDYSRNGPGIDEADLLDFQRLFVLAKRVEGTDRGERKSVWLTFERQ
ncbi:MAG: class I SAM-dependent methyltransferase [Anaerolineales bacterium]